ncbi:hypothetical protein Tco_0574155 [Tanacetum coccineum]
MLSARAALHVSVLTLSFNLSCGPPICGTDGPRSSDEWADVATEACGDSNRGCGTGKRFQGSGVSGCTDDVEFSVPKPGGPDEDAGLDGLIGEVEEWMPLLANGRICGPGVSVLGGGLIGVVLAGLRLVVCGCLGGCFCFGGVAPVVARISGSRDGGVCWVPETGQVNKSMEKTYAVAALIQLDMLQGRINSGGAGRTIYTLLGKTQKNIKIFQKSTPCCSATQPRETSWHFCLKVAAST